MTHAAAETPDGDTISAFDKFGFMPRVGLSVPATRDMATMILAQQIAMPIGISPVAIQAIAAGGGVPVARAPDDARRAVAAEASAIAVSNYGRNNIDSTPSPLRALPAVIAAVDDQLEVSYDGGALRALPAVIAAVDDQLEVSYDGGALRGGDVAASGSARA